VLHKELDLLYIHNVKPSSAVKAHHMAVMQDSARLGSHQAELRHQAHLCRPPTLVRQSISYVRSSVSAQAAYLAAM